VGATATLNEETGEKRRGTIQTKGPTESLAPRSPHPGRAPFSARERERRHPEREGKGVLSAAVVDVVVVVESARAYTGSENASQHHPRGWPSTRVVVGDGAGIGKRLLRRRGWREGVYLRPLSTTPRRTSALFNPSITVAAHFPVPPNASGGGGGGGEVC